MPDPDQRLMRRFQKGDVSAFEVLLHKFQAPVLSLVRRYLGSKSSGIDDVAQEVFVRIYRSKHTYEPRAKVGTWIYRITVNTCLNEIRRLGSEKNRRVAGFTALSATALSATEAEGSELSSRFADPAAVSPAEEVEGGELGGRVRDAVDALPEQQRLAVVLSRWHGLSHEEVADAMESSVPAVKSLLTRARDNLRKALALYVTGAPEGKAAVAGSSEAGNSSDSGEKGDVES